MNHKRYARHLPHYLSLVGLLIAGVVGFWVFSFNSHFQAAVSVSLAIGYLTWGVVHHLIHNDFTLGVFIEYLAISLLGLTAILSLIYWV